MPVGVGRDLGHAAHDHRGGELEPRARLHAVALARQETPERHSRGEQRAGEEAALEVAPGVQHVLGIHAGRARAALGAAAHLPAGGVRGLEAVAAVQHLVADVRGEIELQARADPPAARGWRRSPAAPGRTSAPCCAPRDPCRAPAPACDRTSGSRARGAGTAAADPRPTAGSAARRRCRRRAPGPGSRCATSPGASGSAGARTAARWCRSARAAPGSPPAAGCARTGTTARAARASRRRRRRPARRARACALSSRNHCGARWNTPASSSSSCRRGAALAALDHAQVGHRRAALRVALDAAHRQLLQREPVALAQGAQLGAEKMAFAQQFRHSFTSPPAASPAASAECAM